MLRKLLAHVRALERELTCGLQERELVPGVMAFAFEGITVDLLSSLQEVAQAVGELQFASCAERGFFQRFKDCGSKNVAPDDGQVRGRILKLGFFYQILHCVESSIELAVDPLSIEDAVGRNRRPVDLLSRDH